jgi:hypothetical protein
VFLRDCESEPRPLLFVGSAQHGEHGIFTAARPAKHSPIICLGEQPVALVESVPVGDCR